MAIKPDIAEIHSRKPDPDEPWRYVCPNCDGAKQVTGEAHLDPSVYRCKTGCGKKWEFSELLDLKTGDRVMARDKFD